jgi:hypothetical protein
MAVIVLALSCIPCMDGAYAMTNNAATIENSTSKNRQEQQHKGNDACSPFCTCNCCAGFAFSPFSIKVQSIVHVAAKKYSSYLSSSAIAISLPVWQPPQLVS